MTQAQPPADATPPRPHPPGPPAPAARGRSRVVIAVVVVFVIAAAAVGAYFVYDRFFATVAAEVGDCIAGDMDDVDDVRMADCASPDARYKVVGKVDEQTLKEFNADADLEVCAPFEDTEYAFFEGMGPLTAGDDEAVGSVLCLAPHKP